MTPTYIFLDTETTSVEANRGVVEVAWIQTDDNFRVVNAVQSLIDPEQMISPAASGIHGLTNNDTEDCPTLEMFFSDYRFPDGTVFLGHNVRFDTHTIGRFVDGSYTEACSLRWVRRVYQDSDDYKLSTLIFALDLPRSEGSHRAMADVMSSYHLVKHLCERTGLTLAQYVKVAQEPFLLRKVPFGKYRGETFVDVPGPYLRWMLDKLDLDEDLDYTVKSELKRRKAK